MMRTLKVAFVLVDPLGTDSDGDVLTHESPAEQLQVARIRAHLHALNTQPDYARWFFKNVSKRTRRQHEHAAEELKKLLEKRAEKK